jgi:ElaA protein
MSADGPPVGAVFDRVSDLAEAHAIRRAVFMREQGIPEHLEFEGDDDAYQHWVASRDGRALATMRVRIDEMGSAVLGRIAALPEARGTGLARAMVWHVLGHLVRQGVTEARLGAQAHALGFYEGLGFGAFGEPYMDAGIPHRWMRLRLTRA